MVWVKTAKICRMATLCLRDFRLSQQCCRGCRTFGMWHYATGWANPAVSRDSSALNRKVKQSKIDILNYLTLKMPALCCAVLSLKTGHMDWVRDFDFMLNLFPLPSPWNYYLLLRRIPYRPLRSHSRNRPLVNSRERQSLAAATIPKRFGHCTCSWSTWSVQSMYVFKHEQELVNKVFMLYVFRVGLLNELLLL